MILNVKSSVVQNKSISPIRNTMSATFSYFTLLTDFVRIDKKESMLLVIKKIMATAVNSSINVASLNFRTLMEVRTIKHKPSRLDEVFRI
jgi:hypothetical protein